MHVFVVAVTTGMRTVVEFALLEARGALGSWTGLTELTFFWVPISELLAFCRCKKII